MNQSPFAEPPRLPPRRLNAILMLYDAPLYRDWAFWLTFFWVVMAGWAIATSPPTGSAPVWLDALIAALLFGVIFGVVPAFVRLKIRQFIWKRKARAARQPTRRQPHVVPQQTLEGSLAESQHSPPSAPASSGSLETGPEPQRGTHHLRPIASTTPASMRSRVDPPALRLIDSQSTTQPSDLPQAIPVPRDELPYPVGRAVRALSLSSDGRDTYEAILDTAEALIVSLGIVSASWLRHFGSESRAMTELGRAYLGRGVSQGHWLELAREAERQSGKNGSALPGLADGVRQRKGGTGVIPDLRQLLEERNRWAHGAKPATPTEANMRSREYRVFLDRALADCSFLSRSPWILVEGCSYIRRERTFRVRAQLAMGDHPEFERLTITSSAPLADDTFYLVGNGHAIDLSPFVVMRFCEMCRQPEMFYADRLDRKRGTSLKSFARGHVLFDPDLDPDIRALGHSPGDDAAEST